MQHYKTATLSVYTAEVCTAEVCTAENSNIEYMAFNIKGVGKGLQFFSTWNQV